MVTGANAGIGLQIAKAHLQSTDTSFMQVARNLEKGEAAVAQIGGSSKAIQLDIVEPRSIDAAVKRIQNESGYLTLLLVNNASYIQCGRNRDVVWKIFWELNGPV